MPIPGKCRYHCEPTRVSLESCWGKTINGKPGINVRSHCENVGCVAEALIRQIPLSVRQKLHTNSAITLAAVHDIGKVSPEAALFFNA